MNRGATWFSSSYTHRVPIVVDASASTSGTKDVTITIPPTFARFWDVVQSTGYDVRFTSADGTTELAYNRASWTYASKIGVFNVDATTQPVSNFNYIIYMYWGYAAATDGSTSPTISGALTGYISLIGSMAITPTPFAQFIVGSASPTVQIQKRTTEVRRLWFGPIPLAQRSWLYQNSLNLEGPWTIGCSVPGGGLTFGTANARLVEVGTDLYVTGIVSGGTDGNSYDLFVQVDTTEGLSLQSAITVVVEDLT